MFPAQREKCVWNQKLSKCAAAAAGAGGNALLRGAKPGRFQTPIDGFPGLVFSRSKHRSGALAGGDTAAVFAMRQRAFLEGSRSGRELDFDSLKGPDSDFAKEVKSEPGDRTSKGRREAWNLRKRRQRNFRYNPFQTRRDGRVAEGGGLLNRYRVKSSIGGSNPPLSAIRSVNLQNITS